MYMYMYMYMYIPFTTDVIWVKGEDKSVQCHMYIYRYTCWLIGLKGFFYDNYLVIKV